MAFIPVPNTVQYALRGTLFGRQVVNTLSVQYPAINLETTYDLTAGVLANWWSDNIRPNLTTDFVLNEIYYLDLGNALAPSGVIPLPGGGLAGTNPGIATMPGQVTLCVSFRTGSRGRSGRGRNYISAFPDAEVAGNTILQSRAEAVRFGYAQLPAALSGVDGTHVIVQRFQDNQPLTQGVPREVLTYTLTTNNITSQRRRSRPI